MHPGEGRFWLPLGRLGAFFVTIVIAGNVVFYAFRSATASIPEDPGESIDVFTRKKNRLERRFYHMLDQFFEAPASASSIRVEQIGAGVPGPVPGRITACDNTLPLSTGPAVDRLETPDPEAVEFASPSQREEVPGKPGAASFASPPPLEELGDPAAVAPDIPPPQEVPARLEAVAFAWPVSLGVFSGLESPPPKAEGFFEWPDFRAALVTEAYLRRGGDVLADIGDVLLIGPELMLDGVATAISSLSGRSVSRSWEDEEDRSVSARLLDLQYEPRTQRIFAVFIQQYSESERKYLGAFNESRADTFGFQDRTEGANLGELALDQRKVLLDVLRRTYLARFKVQSEEHIHDGAWYFGRWSGEDFAVLPPLIGAYLYYRGLNKKISMGEMELRISFEPISQFVHRRHDRAAASALEWTVKDFPVGVIVSAGIHDSRYGMDFVGVGTTLGAVRTAVQAQSQNVQR